MGVVSRANEEPRRLAEGESRAGRLLQHANAAFLADLSTNAAWNRFQSQRQRAALLRFTALAVALGLCVSFARHQWLSRSVDVPALVAERVSTPQPAPPPAPSSSGLERRVSPASASLPKARLPARPVASVTPQRTEPVTDSTCRSLANQGQPERAVDCFQSVARERGLPAQVALYEAARLAADALHDSIRALQLIDQHQQRFPDSVLRIEVEWLRIRCLEHAGRLDEALGASEKLLDSAAGRPLAAKLHLLRGRIFGSSRNDCGHALPEYVALLGEPGRAGADAELRRAECLEQLRRPDEARVAYQHYLQRDDARDAEHARARLSALAASSASSTSSTKEQP